MPREALMLTEDENIVNVQLAVQYQVSDARKFLFDVRNPTEVLKQVAESAVREVIGKSEMDFVLKEGRAEVVAKIKTEMQNTLQLYKAGLRVSDVNLQDAQPPDEVQAAFSNAIKAREDKERFKNEAEAYANEVIPKARGTAARHLQEAEAYKESLIAEAEGEASRFSQLYQEYRKAPEVTRKRLYLETMESVLSNTSKVMVDSNNSNSLMYLPIDQLLKQHRSAHSDGSSGAGSAGVDTGNRSTSSSEPPPRPSRSTRETR